MVNEETISEIDTDAQSQKREISRFAIASMVFGMLGPFTAGAMWILSFNDFFTIRSSLIVVLFSCGVAWILGLVLGGKSLEQISNSEGQLAGTEFAVAGILLSVVWMLLIFVALLLPAFFSVNS